MVFEENHSYWVLNLIIRYSGVPWFAAPGGGKTTSLREAVHFSSQEEAIEWRGKWVKAPAVIREVTEKRIYTLKGNLDGGVRTN